MILFCGRREAYTCWSTASGARINNYGTRIDLILAAGPDSAAAGADFHDLFTAADVRMDAQVCATIQVSCARGYNLCLGSLQYPLQTL